ncbi:19429_t:CDS:2 [Dentiscutata erythropus]|uniref:19429_t:CDS:1 n=1 Tax=Dentiscutata erythropus TaxID=1348616 RepID=A0A9N9DVL4_9GLOM|nr:19429_t:CDS:2 [Dentiscutata erythropus]
MNQEDLIQKCLNEERIKFYEYYCFGDFKLIGEGGFGKVHRATFKSNEITVAIKSFKSNASIKEIVKELKLYCKVDIHSNIIRMLGVTKNEGICDDAEHRLALTLDISNGVRENPIEGTPATYVKIYTDCWQHDPESRPDIQHVFFNLKDLNFSNEQVTNIIVQDSNTLITQKSIQTDQDYRNWEDIVEMRLSERVRGREIYCCNWVPYIKLGPETLDDSFQKYFI